nr:MAG: hypothetical protein DIU57_16500 [Pseudomonadota bacterium]
MAVELEISSPRLSLCLLPPPYTQYEPVRSLSIAHLEEIGPGTVLVLAVSRLEEDWPILRETVRRLRQRFPALPVVVRVKERPRMGSFDRGRRTAALGIRAVLAEEDPVPEILRDALTDQSSLADDVVEWLSLRGLRIPPQVAEVVRQIFCRAVQHAELRGLLQSIKASPSTIRKWFRTHGLPSPSCCHDAARALSAALRLQRDQGLSVLTIALELGYADHSALSHQMVRLFGLRPRVIRERLGWEWLLDRWLARRMRSSEG